MLVANRELRTAVIVLSNTAPGNKLDRWAMDLITRTTPPTMRGRNAIAAIRPRHGRPRKHLAGRYQLNPNFIFDVR